MSAIATKVMQLATLATDPAASDAEARTSAFLACTLIRKHGLVVQEAGEKRELPKAPERRMIRARFDSMCRSCGERITTGETCAWCKGSGVVCVDCYREERAA